MAEFAEATFELCPPDGAAGDARLSKPGANSPGRPAAGLCNACRHQQLVRNRRGSVFSLCRRSRTEPGRFPRYPRLPVTSCDGYQSATEVEAD